MFNSVRSVYVFGLAPLATVSARAYVILGSYDTIKTLVEWLDVTLPPFGTLDSLPSDMSTDVGDGKAVDISGWVLDNKGVNQLVVKVDSQTIATLPLTVVRKDVCDYWPGLRAAIHVCERQKMSSDTVVRLECVVSIKHWF